MCVFVCVCACMRVCVWVGGSDVFVSSPTVGRHDYNYYYSHDYKFITR